MKRELAINGLREKLQSSKLDNLDPREGFALLAVVDPKQFDSFHLPSACCLPPKEFESCQERYERKKEIVLYSRDNAAARAAAEELRQLGFLKVQVLLGNVEDWQQAGVNGLAQSLGLPQGRPDTMSIESEENITGEKKA